MIRNILFNKDIILKLRLLFFSFSVFCYYAQFPLRELSSFIVPMLMIYLFLSISDILKKINKNTLLLLSIYYVFIAHLLIISALSFMEINRVIRFFLILAILPVFFLDIHRQKNNYFYNAFILFSCLKSISLIVIYIIFLKMGSFIALREFARSIEGGSIYSLGGLGGMHLYIQVHGNALLLVAFMLRFLRTKKIDLVNVLLLSGIILAGNFAFYLGLLLFFVYCLYMKIISSKKEWYITILFVFLAFIIVTFLFLPYVQKQIYLKSLHSNVVRIEQAMVLLNGNIFTGNGIGNKINAVTSTRIYDGNMYFELQSLYIINQIGFVGYFLFMFVTLYIFYEKNKNKIIIYLIYLFYSFWNPYCFDTTHMIAVLLLINERPLSGRQNKRENLT